MWHSHPPDKQKTCRTCKTYSNHIRNIISKYMQKDANICKSFKLIQEHANHAKNANIYSNIFKNQQNSNSPWFPYIFNNQQTFNKPPIFPNLSRISHSTVRLRQCQCHLDTFFESMMLTVWKSPSRAWVSDTKATSNTWEKKPLVPPSKNRGGERKLKISACHNKKVLFFRGKKTSKTYIEKVATENFTGSLQKIENSTSAQKTVWCLNKCFASWPPRRLESTGNPPPCKWWLPLFWSSWCSCPSSSKVPFAIRFAPWVCKSTINRMDINQTWAKNYEMWKYFFSKKNRISFFRTYFQLQIFEAFG